MTISSQMQIASHGARRVTRRGFVAIGSDRSDWSVSYGQRQLGCSTGRIDIESYLDNPPEDFLGRLGILELSEDFIKLDSGFAIRRETGDGCGLIVSYTDEDDIFYSMPLSGPMKIVDAVEILDGYRGQAGLNLLLALAADYDAPVSTFGDAFYRFDEYVPETGVGQVEHAAVVMA